MFFVAQDLNGDVFVFTFIAFGNGGLDLFRMLQAMLT